MDKPTAFKHLLNAQTVKLLSSEIADIYPDFNQKEFNQVSTKLLPLELKARVLLITDQLRACLPADYQQALKIIVQVMQKGRLKGFQWWPFSEYIGQFGLDYFGDSMQAMYILTQVFTAEFAIRPYLLKDHKRVLKYFSQWTDDQNVHVRRWISEGSRPLLPWGVRLPLFVMDPTYTLVLLDKLKFDEELYVRKSVANHLNDVARNHPQVVVEILRMWEKDCPGEHLEKMKWIKRHALRVLIKKGYAPALKIMGVVEPRLKAINLKLNSTKLKIADKLHFSFTILSTAKRKQKLIIDYKIDFMKGNGSHGTKVFKLKTIEIGPGERMTFTKSHSLKVISTMKYYQGLHHLFIQINGKEVMKAEFELKV